MVKRSGHRHGIFIYIYIYTHSKIYLSFPLETGTFFTDSDDPFSIDFYPVRLQKVNNEQME